MKRYYIEFSYDGSNFKGYQIQPGLRTIQEELQKTLKKINNNKITLVHASGRTDKKVHAYKQTAHFDLDIKITTDKLKRALNSYLPNDIYVYNVKEVPLDFHARYNVKSKKYIYKINLGEYCPTDRNYVYQCCHKLNIKAMRLAITYFEGTHDFRAFVTENKEKSNCVRTIYKASIKKSKMKENQYEICFIGTGFLKYQVRNMVGMLIKIGEGKSKPRDIVDILENPDCLAVIHKAPAEGLYLADVCYDVIM